VDSFTGFGIRNSLSFCSFYKKPNKAKQSKAKQRNNNSKVKQTKIEKERGVFCCPFLAIVLTDVCDLRLLITHLVSSNFSCPFSFDHCIDCPHLIMTHGLSLHHRRALSPVWQIYFYGNCNNLKQFLPQ